MTNHAYHVVRIRRDTTYRHRIIHASTPHDALRQCPARWPAAAYWTTSYRTPQTTWKDLPQYVRNIMSVTGPAATINGWPSGVMPI